jgi:enamine deaminase RidA (YjgF/YER057c/UK114 family)
LEGVWFISAEPFFGDFAGGKVRRKAFGGRPVSATSWRFATRKCADAALRLALVFCFDAFSSREPVSTSRENALVGGALNFDLGAAARSVLRIAWDHLVTTNNKFRSIPPMRILQPAEWSKPRGFSHGVVVDGPGRWIVLAGQTGGDDKGDYPADMAAQVAVALQRIIKLLAEAGAGPQHIVRLTWYLTSRSEYQAAGAGIGAAWKETLGRNFPPSTLLYIDGLVDARAKVEIEVTAFVAQA